ncbi:rubrerythrin family protein [Promethearchaeum syntrophicum]|uniref:Rubrerythrin family protein n=1 Tax=Promethearchaeum syntrophicum TaxID=2594042 RepID=A0A5B9D879_9ARCH|nr:rubrerythrin family protein [Candidatus Prometheoarchaeum syntrophicum]QEE15282.1 Rubrerythrin [Candidatus Prometheoarchaeum syntrophicum]
MTKSEDDLMAAFAGESQANRRYLAFAKKADNEGLKQIARVFRAAAAAETVHAHNHLRAWGGIKTTVENVKEAIEGEHYEFSKMYPEMLEHAKQDGNKKAEISFNYANEVEKIHHKLYNDVLVAAEKGEDLPAKEMSVCPVCGFTVEGEIPEVCPICGAKGETFILIE